MPSKLESQLLEGRQRFLAYIRRRVSDPDVAEDILQDALLKALRSASAIRDEEHVVAWFYQILRNSIIDTYRTRATVSRRLQPIEDMDFPDGADSEDAAELCQCFYDLLPTIKPEYAELIRADLQEEPADSIAARLGITANNLKVRRHRARQALRGRLEDTCRMCAAHGCFDCTCP